MGYAVDVFTWAKKIVPTGLRFYESLRKEKKETFI